jgi:thiol:disulfide interchange protein DsbD
LFFLFVVLLPLAAAKPRIVDVGVFGQGDSQRITLSLEIPEGYHQSFNEDFFFFELVDPAGANLGRIDYPKGIDTETGPAYYGTISLSAPLLPEKLRSTSAQTGKLRLHYQLCDEAGTCFLPGTVEASFSIPIPDKNSFSSSIGGLKGEKGIWLMLAFALLGGILLNIMPCVFPILSIRALNLVKQSRNDKKLLRSGALLYGAGVLVSFLLLALVVIILKQSGELVGWGFQFQNPAFVLALSAVLLVFALSLFDLYLFQPPIFGSKLAAAGSRGLVGSFVNGLVAVILATPCTAPFLGSALGFAFSQPPLLIIFFFLTIGIGFALPFVLLGFIPRIIHRIPKPGPWMELFKEAMGLVLIATALYFFAIFGRQTGAQAMIGALAFLLSLASAAWLYGKLAKPTSSKRQRWLSLLLFVILSSAAAMIFIDPSSWKPQEGSASETAMAEKGDEGVERIVYSPERVETMLRSQQPFLLVFSAQWCSVCKLNDRRIFATERGKELFQRYGIQMVYGDYTNADPVIGEAIKTLGRAGVPVYAFYRPSADKPILLPELLTFEKLEELFSKADHEAETGETPAAQPLGDALFF